MADINNAKMNEAIGVVSKKLGIPPEQLKKELENGKFDSALKNMSPANAAMFNQLINDPGKLEKFMSTPQAQALYKKLSGEK